MRWRRSPRPARSSPFGTDAPVEPIDPWPGIALRRHAGGAGAGRPGRRPSARRTRSRCGARSGPRASTRRSAPASTTAAGWSPGHRADLVVLPAAAVEEPVEAGGALWHARPRLVLVDGEVAVER